MSLWGEFLRNAFAIPQKPPLTPEDRALAQWVARELRARKLDVPAMMVVESCQPLVGITAQLMIFLEPTLSLFLPPAEIVRFREFIEKEGALDYLTGLLDARAAIDQPAATTSPTTSTALSENSSAAASSPEAASSEMTEKP